MANNDKNYTKDELLEIAKKDYARFQAIAQQYFENDYEYFKNEIIPIIESIRNIREKGVIADGKTQIIQNAGNGQIIERELHNQSTQITEVQNRVYTKKKRSKSIYYALTTFILLVIVVGLYYFLIYNNDYRQGVSLIKESRYDLALDKFSKLDSTSEGYSEYIPAINYAKASKYFEEKDYRSALEFYKKVDAQSEFYGQANDYINKIENEPELIYLKAINDIHAKDYDVALNDLKKIKPSDSYYNNSLSKINYVMGVIEFNSGNYEKANDYFITVERTDEFYNDIETRKSKIDEFITMKRDMESNKSYAKTLIDIADDIEDEKQYFSSVNTFPYNRNTYLPSLMNHRSRINESYYGAENKDPDLLDFKSLLIKWVNSYIDYSESINSYGYQANYNGTTMWSYYGNTLNSKKETGNDYHKRVLKKISEIRIKFNLN